MHLLKHKTSGDVYAFHKVLMDSGNFEVYEEQIKELPTPEPVVVKQTRRKKAMREIGELNGTNPQ